MKNQTTQNRLHARMRHSAVLFALLLATQNAFAQDRPIKFEHISIEQGLSQGWVYCILQDRQGFLWFGTQDGLNKYDGYNFTVYRHAGLDSTSLSIGYISSIYEDHTETLWIGTMGGLNKFDREKGQFIHFVNDPKNPHSLSKNQVLSICEDHTGTLWIGTADGLNKFDREKEQFTRFVNDPKNPYSLSENWVFSIYEDHTGTLWIGTNGGLNKLVSSAGSGQALSPASGGVNSSEGSDRKKGQFTRFVHDPNSPYSLSSNAIRSIYEDRAGTLWIGTGTGGLNKFDREKGRFTRFVNDPNNPHSLSENWVSSIYEDHIGTLWIATAYNGLNKLNREKGQFTRFVNDPNNPYSLSSNTICSIHEDRAGTLWIGTQLGGLNKFDRQKERFVHYANEPTNPRSLSNNDIWSIYEDRAGTLWIGTATGGLNKFDREKEQFTRFVNDPKNPHSLSDNWIHSIYEDHTGTLWIGTEGGVLNKFDREKGQFTHFVHYPKNSHIYIDKMIPSIYEDHTGTLWIATGTGLKKFDREKGQFIGYVNDPNNPQSLSTNDIRSIYEDRAGTVWVGTGVGLNKFDREKEQFTRFVNDPNNPRSLSSNSILSIYEDRIGTLWIATSGGGLNKFERETERFTSYTEKDGLPNSVVMGILEDDHGHLWLSTNKGLSCFDPQAKTFRNYDVKDGLQSNEFNMGAHYKNKSGEMFFGGINGFNAFHPDSIKDNPYVPPVVITAFKRYNTDDAEGVAIEEKGMSAKKNLQLSYKDNILAFEFAALSYRNNFKNQYAYKLEGYSDKWISLGTERRVNFTNLSPGEYTLRVKGSNNDGVWNEEGASLKITITPPWWKTIWAYAVYGLVVLAGIYEGNQAQRRRLLAKERALAQIREAELHAQAAEAQAEVLQSENERKKNVELLSEIGKEITASLDMDTIFYKLYEHVNQLADATIFGVGIYHPAKEQIEYRLAFEKGKRYAPYSRDTRDKNQFPVWCIENRSPVFINDVTQEYGRYLEAFKSANVEGMRLEDGTLPEEPFSIIYLPLLSQERVLGVITIQSFQKNAYTEYHLNLLQNLATYTTIALDNADAYRRLDATLQNLKAMQQQLVTQEKLASLGQLTAGIAHEIKNPLNFVNNFAALSMDLVKELRDEIGKIEDGGLKIVDSGSWIVDRESLEKNEDGGSRIVDRESFANIEEILATLEQNAEKINHHGKRADGIVKSMMQHARGSSGKREAANLNHLLDEAVNLVYHGMRANDAAFSITIEKEYDESIGRLEVVPQDLSRVFLNIVNNACYAVYQKKRDTPLKGGIVEKSPLERGVTSESPVEGGQGGVVQNAFSPTLSVSTKNLGDFIEIRIRDNGNGIPPEIREKIFNPFFTTKPTGQGTGLGLSISYDIIVQEHRGEIKVETEEGKFTEFAIRLPKNNNR